MNHFAQARARKTAGESRMEHIWEGRLFWEFLMERLRPLILSDDNHALYDEALTQMGDLEKTNIPGISRNTMELGM